MVNYKKYQLCKLLKRKIQNWSDNKYEKYMFDINVYTIFWNRNFASGLYDKLWNVLSR